MQAWASRRDTQTTASSPTKGLELVSKKSSPVLMSKLCMAILMCTWVLLGNIEQSRKRAWTIHGGKAIQKMVQFTVTRELQLNAKLHMASKVLTPPKIMPTACKVVLVSEFHSGAPPSDFQACQEANQHNHSGRSTIQIQRAMFRDDIQTFRCCAL